MEKKGELTSKQLITIIILIVSFAIILVFLFTLDLKREINTESCRNSVILRGSEIGKTASLQCKTQDVCLTADGDCEQRGKDTVVIKVENKQQMLDEVSDLLYDCWWQMGEGKVDYAPSGIGFEESYCAICNTIKVDESITTKEDLKKIEMKELYLYMQSKKVPNGEVSYLYYLLKLNSMESVRQSILGSSQIDIYEQHLDLTNPKGYAIITGVTKQGWGNTVLYAGVGAIAVGVIVISAGTATPIIVGLSAAVGSAVGGGAGYYVSNGDNKYLSPMVYSYDAEVIKNLDCKEFSTLS